ncbi:invasion associated locus B family protein [Allorhizobium sp. BGMRC 0089]|uniref:invasion associated locus B family protein n=1 Tax=Allorhizobium sonneratiae TaxID=2934936 RepID=UPI00203499A6|nr:invasion associated locus B family protein [Allorhizobium sonneratiae]MCM2294488.1 invasion associated locus B family protein [Allorhizobium sonneratiae]
MTLQTVALMLAIIGLSASVATAAPRMIKQFDHWGLFSYKDGGKTVCYVLSVPVKENPVGVDHGKNFFLIAPKRTGHGAFYPQAIMGYNLKPGSTIGLAIDNDNSFEMMPKKNIGWTRVESQDAQVVSAMKHGHKMTVTAVSARGTHTSYSYSLSGVSAALKQAASCR